MKKTKTKHKTNYIFVYPSTHAHIKSKQMFQPLHPLHIKRHFVLYIFITYLSSKWLHHLTFKSRLLHWRHSAEFINQYGTAEPRPRSRKQVRALQTMATGSMRGEERKWVPGDGARRIFTAINNDNSGNITLPMCCDHSNDWLWFIVSKLTLLTSGLPRKHIVSIRVIAAHWHQLTQCWNWHPSLGADITYRKCNCKCPLPLLFPAERQMSTRAQGLHRSKSFSLSPV